MGYINENLRYFTKEPVKIVKNKTVILDGDPKKVCTVWNNLVGCNMSDYGNHQNYLRILKRQGWTPGKYNLVDQFDQILKSYLLVEKRGTFAPYH